MTTVGSAAPVSLELDDIQSGALHPRPSPYVGTYLLLRIEDAADARELIRRVLPLLDSGQPTADPNRGAWLTVAFTHQGLKALGVSQESLDSFTPEFQQGMAARAVELGDVGESSPSTGSPRSVPPTSTLRYRCCPPTRCRWRCWSSGHNVRSRNCLAYR